MRRVRIIGAGLIGTSIALALAGRKNEIQMVDSNPAHSALAQDLAGRTFEGSADLVIFALPSSHLQEVLLAEFELNPRAIFMDIGSTKAKPQCEIESIPALVFQFCGTHPMAGREIGGPEAARADLFAGRPWIYTPSQATTQKAIDAVIELIENLGATPIRMEIDNHDAAVALVSHLPQISASLLAKQLLSGEEEWMTLAGQGLRDTTRIAGSDPALWDEIISSNREQILPLLAILEADLHQFISDLENKKPIAALISEGRRGRQRIPGKHGGRARDYSYLPIVIEDKAGQLAALFQECAVAGVNIEDLTIEHSPGQFTGLITLALSREGANRLSEHLASRGWNVHSLR
ncbi:MAG TPA: prephenate dehydrogenase [Candidatus Nanopelagicaceae bacterium]